jgi:hypothetical protein
MHITKWIDLKCKINSNDGFLSFSLPKHNKLDGLELLRHIHMMNFHEKSLSLSFSLNITNLKIDGRKRKDGFERSEVED